MTGNGCCQNRYSFLKCAVITNWFHSIPTDWRLILTTVPSFTVTYQLLLTTEHESNIDLIIHPTFTAAKPITKDHLEPSFTVLPN